MLLYLIAIVAAIAAVFMFFRGTALLLHWASEDSGPLGAMGLLTMFVFLFPLMAFIAIFVGIPSLRRGS